MSKVVILSGAPGTGKSTLTNELIEAHKKETGNNPHSFTQVCSADKFFTDKEGKYTFDRSKLGDAHRACLNHFMSVVSSDHMGMTIVDNTSSTLLELAPYVAIARAKGHDVEIISFVCESQAAVEMCAKRNVHGVPLKSIQRMNDNIIRRKLPDYWKFDNISERVVSVRA